MRKNQGEPPREGEFQTESSRVGRSLPGEGKRRWESQGGPGRKLFQTGIEHK